MSRTEEEVYKGEGRVKSSTLQVRLQAVYAEPMSAVVEEVPGLVRRGAIKRKETTYHTPTDRYNADKSSSGRFSFDGPANVGHHRGTGQNERVDPATTFGAILGKEVPRPEAQSKLKKKARLVAKLLS